MLKGVDCLLPQRAEELKKAFQSGEINMEKLYALGSSAKRIAFLEKYVGKGAEMLNVKIEKTFLAPNQKLAARNFIFTDVIGIKPLYKGVSLSQAKKMSENVKINKLKKLSPKQRIEELSKYVDEKTAKELAERFEYLKGRGNLKVWEEKALGTEALKHEGRLRGELAKLQILNETGVLNPKQLENFMQSFVESKLGADITFEQSQELSKLIDKENALFEKIKESNGWTDYKSRLEYEEAVNELQRFKNKLYQEPTAENIGNELIGIFRSNILLSPKSALNSGMYQFSPSLEVAGAKRITPTTLLNVDGSIKEKFKAQMQKGFFIGIEGNKFVLDQVRLALSVYDKTNIDISRTYTIDNGFTFFGEKQRRGAIPLTKFKERASEINKAIKEANGIKEKTAATIRGYAEFTALGPKWMAGFTDTLVSSATKASTVYRGASVRARFEKNTNQLPKGMTEESRKWQLIKESYNPLTTDETAKILSTQGINDAHYSNGTQTDGFAEMLTNVRKSLEVKKIKFGTALVPYLKIPAATISRGVQRATLIEFYKEAVNIKKGMALYKTDRVEGVKIVNKAIAKLIGSMGVMATVGLISLYLDEEDYIPPYITLSNKEYLIAQAQGAKPGDIKIAGHWIPIRYIPAISIPLGATMMARQAKSKGNNFVFDYFKGILAEILGMPVINEFSRLYKTTENAIENSNNFKDFLNKMKLSGDDLWETVKIRIIPSMLSRDLYNSVLPKTKYNIFGEEVEKGLIFRDDKSNEVILEFRRLELSGNSLSILNNDKMKAIDPADLAKLQKNYYKKVVELMDSNRYENLADEDKKKAIDKIRQQEILDNL